MYGVLNLIFGPWQGTLSWRRGCLLAFHSRIEIKVKVPTAIGIKRIVQALFSSNIESLRK